MKPIHIATFASRFGEPVVVRLELAVQEDREQRDERADRALRLGGLAAEADRADEEHAAHELDRLHEHARRLEVLVEERDVRDRAVLRAHALLRHLVLARRVDPRAVPPEQRAEGARHADRDEEEHEHGVRDEAAVLRPCRTPRLGSAPR